MSSTEMIEHIVMLKIRDDEDPIKVNAMMEGVRSLGALPEVLYLTGGPILRPATFHDGLHFTHFFHARYASVSHLHSYLVHPTHTGAAAELAGPIVTDTFAFDWAWSNDHPSPLLPGQALRFTSFKLKDGAEKGEILEGLGKIRVSCDGSFKEMSYGEELSIETFEKGFKIGVVAVFSDLDGLDAGEKYKGELLALTDKFKDSIDGVIQVDFVVPQCSV